MTRLELTAEKRGREHLGAEDRWGEGIMKLSLGPWSTSKLNSPIRPTKRNGKCAGAGFKPWPGAWCETWSWVARAEDRLALGTQDRLA